MAAIVPSITPEKAPRQPACAAPMTRACGSANSSGPQSAVLTPIASPGVLVTIASARGPGLDAPGLVGNDHVR